MSPLSASAPAPPARPRLEHSQIERIAYRALITGRITAEQYREAIAPPRRRRRWLRAQR